MSTLAIGLFYAIVSHTAGGPFAPDPTTTLPEPAPIVSIANDYGGSIFGYAARINAYGAAGSSIRIEGVCASACTLVTAIDADKICVLPDAELRFHAPFRRDTGAHIPAWTAWMRSAYPPPIRRWIDQNGGLTGQLITLKGALLRRLFHVCEAP